ncbi:hypothetical protein Back2_20180 [Nocardioides baekrokdamisoli]|uniref:SMP-30/gluconolactonase/LRE family protein n=1 Tax=Nocardioides baekrokdamisoli TaxID=1804624 RepID=A0A3G9IVL9_9ACTN|nr:hypothetical protein Back2_20180 [Nocardioides baekrokdamisoli]
MAGRSETVFVDRLTLVSAVAWLELEEPVFVDAGDCYWADFDARLIMIETANGATHRLRTKPAGPDSLR